MFLVLRPDPIIKILSIRNTCNEDLLHVFLSLVSSTPSLPSQKLGCQLRPFPLPHPNSFQTSDWYDHLCVLSVHLVYSLHSLTIFTLNYELLVGTVIFNSKATLPSIKWVISTCISWVAYKITFLISSRENHSETSFQIKIQMCCTSSRIEQAIFPTNKKNVK